MEKTFNRKTANEIAKKVQQALSDYFKTSDFIFTVGSGNFSEGKVRLNLDVRIKDDNGGIIISDSEHSVADKAAKDAFLEFEGHIIGSKWNVQDIVYEVVGYYPRRKRYPVSIKHNDTIQKASFRFLFRGKQVVAPTEQEFVKWFTLDPDSDTIKESDAAICDKVQCYLENNYPVEDGDKFFALVDKFNEKGIAKKWAKRAYELLFKECNSMKTAYLGMKVVYKGEMDKLK